MLGLLMLVILIARRSSFYALLDVSESRIFASFIRGGLLIEQRICQKILRRIRNYSCITIHKEIFLCIVFPYLMRSFHKLIKILSRHLIYDSFVVFKEFTY
ncbi:hypothetical protein Droror1_Dr00026162 [Drosera rotundifolia]